MFGLGIGIVLGKAFFNSGLNPKLSEARRLIIY